MTTTTAEIRPVRDTARRCAATTRSGQPCRSPVVLPSGYCGGHDPERAEARAEASRRGGQNSSNIARLHALVPPRLRSVADALEAAMAEVHAGKLDPAKGNAMANIARALVAVLTSGELEQRLRELEADRREGP